MPFLVLNVIKLVVGGCGVGGSVLLHVHRILLCGSLAVPHPWQYKTGSWSVARCKDLAARSVCRTFLLASSGVVILDACRVVCWVKPCMFRKQVEVLRSDSRNSVSGVIVSPFCPVIGGMLFVA